LPRQRDKSPPVAPGASQTAERPRPTKKWAFAHSFSCPSSEVSTIAMIGRESKPLPESFSRNGKTQSSAVGGVWQTCRIKIQVRFDRAHLNGRLAVAFGTVIRGTPARYIRDVSWKACGHQAAQRTSFRLRGNKNSRAAGKRLAQASSLCLSDVMFTNNRSAPMPSSWRVFCSLAMSSATGSAVPNPR